MRPPPIKASGAHSAERRRIFILPRMAVISLDVISARQMAGARLQSQATGGMARLAAANGG